MVKFAKVLHVRLTFLDELLGSGSANPDIHRDYIASKAPDAETIDQEVAAYGADAVAEEKTTVFPRDEDGTPCLWDYQIKGFFKESISFLRRLPGTECKKWKAFKKETDGLIFIVERMIPLHFEGEIGTCQRPLRASTPQGERVALASSESIPAGATAELNIGLLAAEHEAAVIECLDYGELHGMGQWRNSGKGRFTYELL